MCSIRGDDNGGHICGGTLIDKQWVLTAAHCLDRKKSSSPGMGPVIHCNIHDREEQDESKKFVSSQCYFHHLWDGIVSNGNDIALCQLETSASAPFPDLSKLGDTFTTLDAFSVLGWGATSNRGDLSDKLQIGSNLRFVLRSKCSEVEGFDGIIKTSMICAGLGSVDTCKGDSGGPLLIPHSRGDALEEGDPSRDRIVGITSFGLPDCEAEAPGVYTRVSCFRPWIDCIKQGAGLECNVHTPCIEDSSPSSDEDSSLCSDVAESATFDEADALRRITTAITSDDSETVKKQLCDGLSPDTVQGADNDSLLIRAAQHDAIESAKVLLEHGSQIEYKNSFGQTALSRAAGYGSSVVAQLLIDNGADIETRNDRGWTPLTYAAYYGHLRVTEILVENKAEIESKANRGHTPLHLAAEGNRLAVTKFLLENEANIESKTDKGFTPLHLAAEFNSIEVAKELLANDADIQAKNDWGYSPLHIAAYNGALDALYLLLNENAIVEATSNDGSTPLHYAASRGHILVARSLLRNGASKTKTNDDGDTPFDVVCTNKSLDEPCKADVIETLQELLSK